MTDKTRARTAHVRRIEVVFQAYMGAIITGQLAQPGGMLDVPAAIVGARDATLAHAAEIASWISGTIPGD